MSWFCRKTARQTNGKDPDGEKQIKRGPDGCQGRVLSGEGKDYVSSRSSGERGENARRSAPQRGQVKSAEIGPFVPSS